MMLCRIRLDDVFGSNFLELATGRFLTTLCPTLSCPFDSEDRDRLASEKDKCMPDQEEDIFKNKTLYSGDL